MSYEQGKKVVRSMNERTRAGGGGPRIVGDDALEVRSCTMGCFESTLGCDCSF